MYALRYFLSCAFGKKLLADRWSWAFLRKLQNYQYDIIIIFFYFLWCNWLFFFVESDRIVVLRE